MKQLDEGVVVRSWRAADEAGVAAMFSRLSEGSVLRRFHGPGPGGPRHELRYLRTVDGIERFVVVAEARGRIVGLARYHRTEPGHAEIAVVVEDDWQRHGVGRHLLAELAATARRAGVAAFDVSIMGDNDAALGLLRRSARHFALHLDHGVFEGSIPIAAGRSVA